jgi:uncharacterized repeat protein (TIGR03803 family)
VLLAPKPARAILVLRVTLAVAIGVQVSAEPANAQTGLEVLHVFASRQGLINQGFLIQATDGNFYGTTTEGGASGFGTVFKMIPDGTVSVLHVFVGGTTDVYPQAALIQATDGNFYRTTTAGGTSDAGTVFKMTPAGAVTVLHDFSVETDAFPQAPPIQATDGNLYGTMYGRQGGPCGTAFKITASGVLTVLYGFTCDNNGGFPAAPLVQATDGNLYGTTSWDGARTGGTIFKLIPGGTLTVLHAFTDADGHQSYAPLIQATGGNFYGTTTGGGAFGFGTVFTMTRSVHAHRPPRISS